MSRAVVVVGNALRFYEAGLMFAKTLNLVCGVEKTTFIEGYRRSPGRLLRELWDAIERPLPGEPLLIAYVGHGLPNMWAIDDDTNKVSYSDIVTFMNSYKNPVLFVNECCHAGSALQELVKQKGTNAHIGFIGACAALELSYTTLLDRLMVCWTDGKPYRPTSDEATRNIMMSSSGAPTVTITDARNQPMTRMFWGVDLEHNFFRSAEQKTRSLFSDWKNRKNSVRMW